MATVAKHIALWAALLVAGTCSAQSSAKSEYDRRSVERFQQLFQALDRDADKAVTLAEAWGDLNFSPFFRDMDINRDGVVTEEELNRYLSVQYASK